MKYTNHLYLILYPNEALVASHLEPEAFAKHYLIGSVRHYNGKLVFAQVDPNFRDPDFDLENTFSNLKPHEDGTPKRTKFIASYRVLEHIDLDRLQGLFLCTSEAHVLKLEAKPYDKVHRPGFLRTYAEIAPLSMLVMSPYEMPEFGKFITAPGHAKGCPKLFYAQIELDVDGFLSRFENNPFTPAPFPFLHPSKLRDAIQEMKIKPAKRTKGLSLYCPLEQISFKLIRHGFMFASQDKTRFYPMPSLHDIEANHFKFWQDM